MKFFMAIQAMLFFALLFALRYSSSKSYSFADSQTLSRSSMFIDLNGDLTAWKKYQKTWRKYQNRLKTACFHVYYDVPRLRKGDMS